MLGADAAGKAAIQKVASSSDGVRVLIKSLDTVDTVSGSAGKDAAVSQSVVALAAHSALAAFEIIEALVADPATGKDVQKALAMVDGAKLLSKAMDVHRDSRDIQECGRRILAQSAAWFAEVEGRRKQMQKKAGLF